jgi:hypothetical protein
MAAAADRVSVNRAPVLTLWAAVVAERLGFDRDEALTLGRALAGMNAQTKGQRLGIRAPREPGKPARRKREPAGRKLVELMGRGIPAVPTDAGLRALDSGGGPADPEAVERYLERRFGPALPEARRTMKALAASLDPDTLARRAFALYETFRPAIPTGKAGWGAKGVLDLARVRALAKESG